MAKKKKKHVQNEKERIHQEQSAIKRAEKAVAEKKHERQSALVLLAISSAILVLSCVFLGLNISKMRRYELNYVRTYGTVIKFTLHRGGGNHSTYYVPVFEYTYGGQTYKAEDWESTGYRSSLIGKKVEIYVNPENPQKAGMVNTADGFSIMSVCFFAMSMVVYFVGMNVLISGPRNSISRRTLCAWLPMAVMSFIFIALCKLGLPKDGFGAVFSRVRGVWGAVVVICLAVLSFIIDAVITLRRKY